MNISNSGVVRINITVPKKLLSELEGEVLERGKSRFVTEAIEEKLAKKRKADALNKLLSLPPLFTSIKDSVKYIADERARDDRDRQEHVN